MLAFLNLQPASLQLTERALKIAGILVLLNQLIGLPEIDERSAGGVIEFKAAVKINQHNQPNPALRTVLADSPAET